jgi:dihydrofolate reductase
VVAIGRNRAMGLNGQLPWHLPADLRHFREVTMDKPMLMGRKTWESIGRPLPGRTSIVLTGDPAYIAEGALVAHSLPEALELAGPGEASVIGGASLFHESMLIAHRIYLTVIEEEFEADVFFPQLQGSWRLVSETHFLPDERNQWPYRFLLLEQGPTEDPFDLDAALLG